MKENLNEVEESRGEKINKVEMVERGSSVENSVNKEGGVAGLIHNSIQMRHLSVLAAN